MNRCIVTFTHSWETLCCGILFLTSAYAASYPTQAHVIGSTIVVHCDEVRGGSSQCNPYLTLTVVVDGLHLSLEGGKARQGLLIPGDYKARLVDNKKKVDFVDQTHELQYSDGST